jgi:hypothetical protein
MKCNFIDERIADVFDESISITEKEELHAHIRECEDCRKAYAQYFSLAAALETESEPVVYRAPWRSFIRIAASITVFLGIAAGVLYLALYRNPALAAGTVLENSISELSSLNAVYMVFSVRTEENGSFESIDPAEGFISFRVWTRFGKNPKWRFEKPGRYVIMDGFSQYLVNDVGGYVLQGTPKAGFIGWMKQVLQPMSIIGTELAYARSHPSSCSVKREGDLILLTVKAAASGDFTNPWALNTSIPEAETRRVYTFSKDSHMLTGLSVFVKSGAEDICVMKLTDIKANPVLPDSLLIFRNNNNYPVLTLVQWDSATSNGLKDITAENAVRTFFKSCEKEDWAMTERFSPLFTVRSANALKSVQARFGGSRLLKVGNSFNSGIYAGVYVPYVVLLRSGDTISGNIAIRNDNSYHTWSIDGGY